jgi:hypothetical protein
MPSLAHTSFMAHIRHSARQSGKGPFFNGLLIYLTKSLKNKPKNISTMQRCAECREYELLKGVQSKSRVIAPQEWDKLKKDIIGDIKK